MANETRLNIIVCLYTYQKKNVSELLASCNLSQSALSQHLAILRECGIVTATKNGKYNTYRLVNRKIITLTRMLLAESHKH